MQVSTSAYYAWAQASENTEKVKQKAALEAKVRQLFEAHKKPTVRAGCQTRWKSKALLRAATECVT
jgi:hypothetical protein